jgi:MFS family permease
VKANGWATGLASKWSRDAGSHLPTGASRVEQVHVLLLAISFLFFSYIARFGYGALVPRMIEEMGFSRAEVGIAYSVFIFMYSAFSVVSGRLFDKYGVKVVVILTFVYGLGLVLASVSSNLLALTASLAIAGLGASSTWTPMVALVSSKIPEPRRGWSTGLLEVGIRSSHGLAGFLIPLLVFVMGLRATWLVISLPLFIYCLVFYALSKSELLRVRVKARKEVVSYKTLLSSKEFWLVGFSYFFMSFASYIILTFLVDFLEREVGMPYAIASAMAGIIGFVGIAGAFLLSWISDKIGRVVILILSNAVASLNIYLLVLSLTNETLKASLSLVVAVYGFFFGAPWPIYAAYAGDLFPSSVGTVLGLWTLMMGLGALGAPSIGGLQADLFNSYVPALLLSSTAYLVAMSLMVATAITRGRQGSPRA